MQKFQDIEEMHLSHMKEIIESFSNTVKEVHIQIGEVSFWLWFLISLAVNLDSLAEKA